LRDPEYSVRRKLLYVLINPLFHAQKWRGVRRGAMASAPPEPAEKE
jgi:rhamnosyltransferase